MARKSDPYRDPQPFNDRAHEIVRDMIEAAELVLARNRLCHASEANEVIAMNYIRECGSLLNGISFYVENEGRIAADIFLGKLANAAKPMLRQRYHRSHRICGIHLHWHVRYYFPTFLGSLRKLSLLLLQQSRHVRTIDQNGILKLAAANLPNVKADINNHRRRLGASSDRLIISKDDRNRRIAHTSEGVLREILSLYEECI
jgi:hypothetical protein